MSTTTPPEGPGGPEYLEHGAGDPVPPSSSEGGNGRRTALVAGGAVVALAAAGAGTWAALSFLGSGAQPAEALPAGTLAYASVDLDPSGEQKIEAFRMLNKFPAFKEEFGLDAADDVRRTIVEEALKDCDSISYADDVEPWLGTSFAMAAVEAGEKEPSPVAVIEVTDAAAAEEGLAALRDCGDGADAGWVVEGDWAVVAETETIAQQVTDATADGTLADDADYQRWMDEAGDPGVVSMYASPDVGPLLSELAAGDLGAMPGRPTEVPEEAEKALEEFPGAAGTVRFADGAVELEVVGGAVQDPVFRPGEEGADLVGSLPDDTAVAFGLVFADGWGQRLLDQVATMTGGQMTADDLAAQAEAMTGLSIPDDVEALFGDSMALALSGDFTLEGAMASADGSDVPVGIKVRGDAARIEELIGQVAQRMGPGFSDVLGTESDGDTVAVSPSPDYRSQLLGDGGLGDSEAFQAVVPEADRSPVVLFVNFDAGDWLTGLTAGDQAAADNLAPLDALGVSMWQDDDTVHGLVKLTTD